VAVKKRTSGIQTTERLVAGWNEYVDLPAWGVTGLRAKMDSGARTSALHVENIEERPGGRVRFDVILDRRRRHRLVHVETRILRRGRVRSSSGHYTMRIFVATTLRLGRLEREVEVSLVDREKLIFRMLLGRSALDGVMIDVAHRCLLSQRPLRRKKARRR
jgi:hypothetical protein